MAAQVAEEGMSSLQSWLSKPRATVRIERTIPWAAWLKMMRRPFGSGKRDMRPQIEVLDRLALGGKKSLLLIAIEERRLLIGVGDDAAPALLNIEHPRTARSRMLARRSRVASRAGRRVRR
jgi:flagellar biogenesis protein FliO